jgi:hypothetical protein
MPTDLSLSTVILAVISHTPRYVWFILAGLIVAGSLQMRDHIVTPARLAIAPIALGGYSLWGVTAAFGMRPEVLAAWLSGIALAFVANRWLRWPRAVRSEGDGRFALEGSPWPLIAMLTVFAMRYGVAVTLVFHRSWAHEAGFSLAAALAYGALSGLFAARAVRILREDAPPLRVVAA